MTEPALFGGAFFEETFIRMKLRGIERGDVYSR
jgi:hypothetical protein